MIEKQTKVKLKGREPQGNVKKVGVDSHWVTVKWDKNKKQGPKYVHEFELQVIA